MAQSVHMVAPDPEANFPFGHALQISIFRHDDRHEEKEREVDAPATPDAGRYQMMALARRRDGVDGEHICC